MPWLELAAEVLLIAGAAQRTTELFDGGVQPLVEIDGDAVRPEQLLQFFAADNFSVAFQQGDENLKRLILQPNRNASLEEFARPEICLEQTETDPILIGHRSLHDDTEKQTHSLSPIITDGVPYTVSVQTPLQAHQSNTVARSARSREQTG